MRPNRAARFVYRQRAKVILNAGCVSPVRGYAAGALAWVVHVTFAAYGHATLPQELPTGQPHSGIRSGCGAHTLGMDGITGGDGHIGVGTIAG